jgi:hypothetical protein
MDVGGLNAGPPGTELCWGQGNPADLTDVSGGNHDPTNVTEQSSCRSNRSCWDQVGWSWPNTFLVPAGAPDPDANGLVVNPLTFLTPAPTARLVLVLDRSGSMAEESPARLERLKVAALDFVNLAENGVELGLVSFSGSGSDEVAIAALGADRSAYVNAINGLTASGATNIGDGLQHARDMITTAGGVTANTAVVLMTDGINNRPAPDATAAADLQAKVDALLADGIPVFVTCTGTDLGLDSQCAEIAAGTNGTYVDSAASTDLPESFTDLHELFMGRQGVRSKRGTIGLKTPQTYDVLVEPGARQGDFVVVWTRAKSHLLLTVTDPDGTVHQGLPIPQGQYVRVATPKSGTWKVTIRARRTEGLERFVSRAYVGNQDVVLTGSARRARVQPGEPLVLYAIPRFPGPVGGDLEVAGEVTKPDGTLVPVVLTDDGRAVDSGDDVQGDGIYTTTFTDTAQRGAYTVRLELTARDPVLVGHTRALDHAETKAPPFQREVRFSATVDDRLAGLDHFRCYPARTKTRLEPRQVELKDQFGGGQATVVKPVLLCNPTRKNDEEIQDSTAHLVCYQTRDRGERRDVLVRNQFGDQRLVVAKPGLLCVPSEKNGEASRLALDHFRCYRAKVRRKGVPRRVVALQDQFGTARALVGPPLAFCNPTRKNDEGIRNPDAHLTCYATRESRRKGRATQAEVKNQFGSLALRLGASHLLCVPSLKSEPTAPTSSTSTTSTTRTTSSSTTSTTLGLPCGQSAFPACQGTCPTGGQCVAASTFCACR